jgi:CDP-diglyceride synthetase
MHDMILERWQKRFREYYVPHRHTALLVAIVAFIAVWPVIGTVRVARIVFGIALVILLVVALYTIQVEELVGDRKKLLAERRRRNIIGWTLAGAAVVERVLAFVWPTHTLYLIGSVCYLLFFSFVIWQELRAVLRQGVVSAETISMSISVYLLMGVAWGLLYAVIYERHPQSFNL